MDNETVGQLVHKAWKDSEVPQKEVLAKMGITRSHFNNIARGVYPPDVQFLTKLAVAIGGHLILDIEGPGRPRVTLVVRPDMAQLVSLVQSHLDPETQDALTVIVGDEKARTMFSELVNRIAEGIRKDEKATAGGAR